MKKFYCIILGLVAGIVLFLPLYAQNDRQDLHQRYEDMLTAYSHGNRDPEFLKTFALVAQSAKHHDIANDAAKEYLRTLAKDAISTKPTVDFLEHVTGNTADVGFEVLYRNSADIDKVQGEGFAEREVDQLIRDTDELLRHTQLSPFASLASQATVAEPDWNSIQEKLAHKYDEITASRTVLEAKALWYAGMKKWQEFTTSALSFVRTYGPSESNLKINDSCWNIFLHSMDKEELTAAAIWIQGSFDHNLDADYSDVLFDTYANLQYKAGNKDEAIRSETKAIEADKALIEKYGDKAIRNLPSHTFPAELTYHQQALEKMKHDEPTWTTN